MQGTWVRSLVWEDPPCRGATKPMHHNYWACALGSASHNYWAHVPQLLKPERPRAHMPQLLSPRAATTEARTPRARAPRQEKPPVRSPRSATRSSPRSPRLEKARTQQQSPNAVKKKTNSSQACDMCVCVWERQTEWNEGLCCLVWKEMGRLTVEMYMYSSSSSPKEKVYSIGK